MTTQSKCIERVGTTLEEAQQKAATVAIESDRQICPVRIFKQGKRDMVSGVLPVKVLDRILRYNSADKGVTADKALSANNRPIITDHWKSFASYLSKALEDDAPFIIPPLTLNTTGEILIYAPEGPGNAQSGYAVLPDETSIFITDGQHRFKGIQQVISDTRGTDRGTDFMNTGIPFLMTIEANKVQVHQDFADAGRTRSLPPSLLAVYDTRQPANGAVLTIIERTDLLRDRVDATSNSVGKGSPYVFLVNQVREFVKHSLVGATGVKDSRFNEEAAACLTNEEAKERWIRSRVAFLNVMTEIVPEWNAVAQLSPPYQADSDTVVQKTKEIKAKQNVPLNGAFLTAVGLVSHVVLRDITSIDREEPEIMEHLRKVLKPLNNVDWTRKGELWQDNIVTGDKIRTQAPAVKAASQKMLEHIGLASTEQTA